jgi:hypothetical protein
VTAVQAEEKARSPWRWLGPILTVLATAGVGLGTRELAPARGVPYRASSAQDGHQQKGWTRIFAGSDGIFLHTKREDGPWVEIDIGDRRFRRVHVVNRSKHRERASPLVLEVGVGRKKWREIGRKEEPFDEATFEVPATRASKIRLRVDKKRTFLHLREVRVD